MKKLIGILAAVALATAACGGSPPEQAEEQGIAALEDEKKDAPAGGDKGGAAKDQPDEKKRKPRPGKGGGEQTATGGGSTGGGGDPQGGSGSGGGGDEPSSTQAQAAAPIPAGRYEYTTDGERTVSGNSEPLPETTTLTAAAPNDGTQRQTRDLRDSEGNGIVTETDLVYGDGGVSLAYVKITSRFQGGLTDVREFRLPQPQLIAPRGGGPGYSRSFTMEGSGTRAKVSIEAHRYEDVTVAGGSVRALLVQTDITFSGALEGYQRSTSWFWPKHLLTLEEQVRTDVRNGPIRLQGNYEAVIKRLP